MTNKNKYLIISDDFTGSNDTGVQMKKRGIPVQVILFPDKNISQDSVVLDTESRNISSQDSYNKVKNMVSNILEDNEYNLVYKKIDSTLRGNIVDEIKAINEVYKATKIIFAPAFPEIGRVIKNGIHYLNGVPLLETEVSKDPLSPIKTDNINDLLQSGFEETVIFHNKKEIDNGNIDISEGFLHTFDSLTYDDMRIIAREILQVEERILWVGSAGLADAIFDILYPSFAAMGIVGSISEKSIEQINYAEEKGTKVIQIEIPDLFDKSSYKKYVKQAVENLENKKDIIITATRSRDQYYETLQYAEHKKKINSNDASWYVQTYLATLTKKILEKSKVSGLFLTGGDTAIAVIDSLEAEGCKIQSEILTGMVASTLNKGPHSGLSIITKAGAFGEKEDLNYCIKRLKENNL